MIEEILEKLSNPVQIEIFENVMQKPLTESEKAKIQNLIKKELEKNTHQGKRTDLITSSKNLVKVSHGTYEKIGRIFQESHEKVRQREFVFNTISKNEKLYENLKNRLNSGKTSISFAFQMLRQEEFKEIPTPDLPTDEYDLVYLDPPWDYNLKKSGSPPFKTMKLEKMKVEIKIPAYKDCIMFMWATNPKLTDAFALFEHWGFQYKTNIVWVKQKNDKLQQGTGYYVKGSHELLLIATKGSPGVPPESSRIPSVVFAQRTSKHSEKPKIFRKIINEMYKSKKKIEMFSRGKDEYHNDTWSYWGDEL